MRNKSYRLLLILFFSSCLILLPSCNAITSQNIKIQESNPGIMRNPANGGPGPGNSPDMNRDNRPNKNVPQGAR